MGRRFMSGGIPKVRYWVALAKMHRSGKKHTEATGEIGGTGEILQE